MADVTGESGGARLRFTSDPYGPYPLEGADRILALVRVERGEQERKWGEQNHSPFIWLTILGEEFGEACKAAVEGDVSGACRELIQAAAVCVAAVESFDRNRGAGFLNVVAEQLEKQNGGA